MLKRLLLIICYILTAYKTVQAGTQELAELVSTLNQLEAINATFALPLENKIKEAINGNPTLLDADHSPLAQAAKYMVSISDGVKNRSELLSTILLFLKLFDRVKAKYNVKDKIIITSVASGNLEKEEILLRTLSNFGYRSIQFYAIDPDPSTKNAIQKFKTDESLKNYNYHQFNDTKDYIEGVGKDELPNVCITFNPNIFMNTTAKYKPSQDNTCNNRGKNQPITTMLILPNYIKNEMSIITEDKNVIEDINEKLEKFRNTPFELIKLSLPKIILKQNYLCEQNVLLNFLEIIKLSSSAGNDCIAYYGAGSTDIDTFHNIASKTIGQLYIETPSIAPYYESVFKIDLRKFQLWNYNPLSKQFENENT